MTNPVERRGWKRTDAVYQITYEYFNASGNKVDTGAARTVNISGRGALVEMSRGVDLDASLILWIMSPFRTILVKGSVVHSRGIANGMYHVGVKLTDVIEGTWDIWEKIAQPETEENLY